MRLIDADKLKKQMHCEYSDDLGILEKIDEQPTAYDVDKVKSQMKELVEYPCGKSKKCIHAYDNFYEEHGGCEKCVAFRADDIVKAGGKDD